MSTLTATCPNAVCATTMRQNSTLVSQLKGNRCARPLMTKLLAGKPNWKPHACALSRHSQLQSERRKLWFSSSTPTQNNITGWRDVARNNAQCSSTLSMAPLCVNMPNQKHAPYRAKGLGKGLHISFICIHVVLFSAATTLFPWISILKISATTSSSRLLCTRTGHSLVSSLILSCPVKESHFTFEHTLAKGLLRVKWEQGFASFFLLLLLTGKMSTRLLGRLEKW